MQIHQLEKKLTFGRYLGRENTKTPPIASLVLSAQQMYADPSVRKKVDLPRKH